MPGLQMGPPGTGQGCVTSQSGEPDPPPRAVPKGAGQADLKGQPGSHGLPRLGAFERTSGTGASRRLVSGFKKPKR